MDFFDLPIRSYVGRVVPKNAFDNYTNTKQKKLFTDFIQRISWTHKLSSETINLSGRDINEIQLFKIELKLKANIKKILDIIDKHIPYHIVFWVEFGKEAFISTSSKHPHPTQEDISVVDWRFSSDWFLKDESQFRFALKGSLDAVFKDICIQLSGRPELSSLPLVSILDIQQEVDRLTRLISKLKSSIKKSKQFNEKVELNIELKRAQKELEEVWGVG